MIPLGQYHLLTAIRRQVQGIYLADEKGEEVLLPNKYVPDYLVEGDEIWVFVYLDSGNRPVSTTLVPKIALNQFALLEVSAVSEVGAFMDWGLEKDLLVPFAEQFRKMAVGEFHVVYAYLDTASNRLVASARTDRYLDNENLSVELGEKVEILIAGATDLGVNVIINDKHKGLIFQNEIFQRLRYGHRMDGYILQIREDNKIDVGLRKPGYDHIEPSARKIMERLDANEGFLPLHDKSDPDLITKELEMSKKTFKKAIGALYRQQLIRIEPDGIFRVNA